MNFEALEQILGCGQCFRWHHLADDSWQGAVGGRSVRITAENLPHVLQDPFWAHYFDAETDYAAIRAGFARKSPVLAEAVRFAPEIRILNQEPWEAFCSFILSQCNNIRRIQGMVERLCKAYGTPAGGGSFTFPAAEVLAEVPEQELRALGLGFRAPYVLDAARRVTAGELDFSALKTMPLWEVHQKLEKTCGVGPKVADCALLYGLHRLEAFPMDVWMKRAMKAFFPGKTPDWFGPYAGVAQQYIFHFSRNHPECFQANGNQ